MNLEKNSQDHLSRCKTSPRQIECTFVIKVIVKVGIEGTYVNLKMKCLNMSNSW